MIFSRKLGGIHFSPLPVGKIWAYMVRYYCPNSYFRWQLACYGPNHTSKRPASFFLNQKLHLLKIFKFWIWLRFSRYGIFAILKYVKIPKPSKICNLKKCPLKHKKRKYLKWFWPVTEGITLLTWKRIIKHYIKKFIFKTFKDLKI